MVDPRQLFLLFLALVVPAFFIVTRRERHLLAWICLTAGVNIFDTKVVFLNMPAARLAGLLLIPQAIRILPSIVQISSGKALIMQYVYLVFLGLIFGFIFPWPDDGLSRGFTQLAQGRTLIYLLRTAADISLIFFVARQVVKQKSFDEIIKYFLIGTAASAIVGVFEFVTQIDLLDVISGISYNKNGIRARGFNYEPRALGLMAIHGILLSFLLYSYRRSKKYLVLIGIYVLGFVVSGSTSAFGAVALGISVLFLFERRARGGFMIGMAIVGILILGIPAITEFRALASFSQSIDTRVLAGRLELTPENIIEYLTFRMDIFDGPAVLFLLAHPFYLFTGTGPGLVPLPATSYMPQSVIFKELAETGINSPPFIGGLLEISNAGFIGLTLLFIICSSSLRALKYLCTQSNREYETWAMGRSAFAVVAAIYLAQSSPLSPIWPIFIGIGLAATYLARLQCKLPVVLV